MNFFSVIVLCPLASEGERPGAVLGIRARDPRPFYAAFEAPIRGIVETASGPDATASLDVVGSCRFWVGRRSQGSG